MAINRIGSSNNICSCRLSYKRTKKMVQNCLLNAHGHWPLARPSPALGQLELSVHLFGLPGLSLFYRTNHFCFCHFWQRFESTTWPTTTLPHAKNRYKSWLQCIMQLAMEWTATASVQCAKLSHGFAQFVIHPVASSPQKRRSACEGVAHWTVTYW